MLRGVTTAMLLAAGLGTRLRPITSELPKPLVWVGDRPAAAHVVASLARAGVHRVVVNAHHLAADVVAWAATLEPPTRVSVSLEPGEILGTAGGVANAERALGEGDVVVWNGDILAPTLDVGALLARHAGADAAATWVVAPRDRGEGTVGLGADGRVVRLRGRRFGDETTGGDFVGVQVLGAATRARLPRVGCLVGDVALPLLESGGVLATFALEGAWDDVGDPAALAEANLRWLARAGTSSFVGRGASVAAGVSLERSVVADGAVVEGEGVLRDVVVLAGARATAPLERAIVGRACVVGLDSR